MTDLVSLNSIRAEKAGDNGLVSPVEVLRNVIAEIEAGKIDPDKLMVLHLSTKGDVYDSGWYAADLRSSEMIALCEVTKANLIDMMNGR